MFLVIDCYGDIFTTPRLEDADYEHVIDLDKMMFLEDDDWFEILELT